mgnify:CR=1 FL=1
MDGADGAAFVFCRGGVGVDGLGVGVATVVDYEGEG